MYTLRYFTQEECKTLYYHPELEIQHTAAHQSNFVEDTLFKVASFYIYWTVVYPLGSMSNSLCKLTPVGSVHKSSGDNVVRMWLMLKT